MTQARKEGQVGRTKMGKCRGSRSVIVMGYRKSGWADNLRRQKNISDAYCLLCCRVFDVVAVCKIKDNPK